MQDGVEAFANGALLIDKPADWTSFDVCGKLRNSLRFTGKLKVGQAAGVQLNFATAGSWGESYAGSFPHPGPQPGSKLRPNCKTQRQLRASVYSSHPPPTSLGAVHPLVS